MWYGGVFVPGFMRIGRSVNYRSKGLKVRSTSRSLRVLRLKQPCVHRLTNTSGSVLHRLPGCSVGRGLPRISCRALRSMRLAAATPAIWNIGVCTSRRDRRFSVSGLWRRGQIISASSWRWYTGWRCSRKATVRCRSIPTVAMQCNGCDSKNAGRN